MENNGGQAGQLELFNFNEPPEFIETCWNLIDIESGSCDLQGKLDCITCHKVRNQKFICKRELSLYGFTHLGTEAEWQKVRNRIEEKSNKEKKDGEETA